MACPVSGLVTSEAGGVATFDVVLQSEPTADVSIAVASSNPAEGRITVRCALPRPGSATVELLDVAGRQLALLRLEMDSPGVRLLEIGESERLGPGIYFLRLTQGAHTARTRISLVR